MNKYVKLFEEFNNEEDLNAYAKSLPSYKECLKYGLEFTDAVRGEKVSVFGSIPNNKAELYDEVFTNGGHSAEQVAVVMSNDSHQIVFGAYKKATFGNSITTQLFFPIMLEIPIAIRKDPKALIEFIFDKIAQTMPKFNEVIIKRDLGYNLKTTDDSINDEIAGLKISSTINDLW